MRRLHSACCTALLTAATGAMLCIVYRYCVWERGLHRPQGCGVKDVSIDAAHGKQRQLPALHSIICSSVAVAAEQTCINRDEILCAHSNFVNLVALGGKAHMLDGVGDNSVHVGVIWSNGAVVQHIAPTTTCVMAAFARWLRASTTLTPEEKVGVIESFYYWPPGSKGALFLLLNDIAHNYQSGDELRVRVLEHMADILRQFYHEDRARVLYNEAEDIHRWYGSNGDERRVLEKLVTMYEDAGNEEMIEKHLTRAITLADQCHDNLAACWLRVELCESLMFQGRYEECERAMQHIAKYNPTVYEHEYCSKLRARMHARQRCSRGCAVVAEGEMDDVPGMPSDWHEVMDRPERYRDMMRSVFSTMIAKEHIHVPKLQMKRQP